MTAESESLHRPRLSRPKDRGVTRQGRSGGGRRRLVMAGAKRRARIRRRWRGHGRAGRPPALCGSAGGAGRSLERVWTLPARPLESLPAVLTLKGAGGGRPRGTRRCCWHCRGRCGCGKPSGSFRDGCSKSRRAAAARPARRNHSSDGLVSPEPGWGPGVVQAGSPSAWGRSRNKRRRRRQVWP